MEEQKKPADQQNKRQRVSENAESSNKKPSHMNGLKVHLGQPVGVSPNPGVTGTRPLASPSPFAKAKPIAVVKPAAATVTVTGPVDTMAPASAAPSPVAKAKPTAATVTVTGPVDTMAPASAARIPVAKAKPTAAMVTVTGPVATMAPVSAAPNPVAKAKPTAATVTVSGPVATMSPVQAAPNPVAMKTPTPAAPSPVVTMAPAAPSPVATMTLAQVAPSPVATKTPASAEPSVVTTKTPAVAASIPVASATPATLVNPPATVKREPELGGVLEFDEQVAAAMIAVTPAEEETVILEVKKKWLHCAACPAPLKRPVFKCGDGHVVCSDCGCGGGANKHCDLCGRATTYTHVPYMDGLVGAYKVPCPYRNLGCARYIAYHSAADHQAKCAHAPCYCFECAFQGSTASLLRHLTEVSGRHCWPMEKIKYQISHPLVVPASEHRLLLVAEEDGGVFLLAVGAGRGRAGVCPVTVVCVRGNVHADARPVYTGVLWVDGPPAAAGHLRSSIQLKGDVANCRVPGDVDMEHGRLHAHVNPEMLHGESKEIHLGICITKFW
ncbi:E3 ubiquitin-protein ligase [Hordeum vulgare]|uniref:SIAH-type domain-containing protein n=2 Tax=Hordeum vulgare subsp. vulgare TaxID=112509 RepID=A0A8I6XXN2_HORVV|nr:A-kinase anchor protein 14-like isoform X2 [Hordeum vulgare subsp. vulgare]KAE8781120.1 E3 ubiquitin-protein ligase [Hordeum vulgare]